MAPKARGGGWCVCKYCHRSNKDTVNPWVPSEWQGRDQGDSSKMMLQFRRDRGKECSSCCALIRSNKRDYFVDPNLDKLLEADANKQSEFLQDLEEFEHKKRSDALAKASKGCWVANSHVKNQQTFNLRVWTRWSRAAKAERRVLPISFVWPRSGWRRSWVFGWYIYC